MATINTTPSLGINLDYNGGVPYWDNGTVPSPQLGSAARGVDGHIYHWVKASAAISAAASPGTAIAITEPGFTAATGAGGFTAPPAGVAIGTYFWARKATI
jgi:hypothetical protein